MAWLQFEGLLTDDIEAEILQNRIDVRQHQLLRLTEHLEAQFCASL